MQFYLQLVPTSAHLNVVEHLAAKTSSNYQVINDWRGRRWGCGGCDDHWLFESEKPEEITWAVKEARFWDKGRAAERCEKSARRFIHPSEISCYRRSLAVSILYDHNRIWWQFNLLAGILISWLFDFYGNGWAELWRGRAVNVSESISSNTRLFTEKSLNEMIRGFFKK